MAPRGRVQSTPDGPASPVSSVTSGDL